MTYAFGDSEPAARRLALVARVFEPASAEFLASAGRRGGALAVDLGCGPGHTTELLARATGCERCVGLDASPAYVEAARRRAPAGCEFACHDVLATPYPTGRADTVYARFLVTHLADPAAAIALFASQLAPGGQLLLDEVESIESEGGAFRRYLALVDAVLAAQGQSLFVGPHLARIAERHPRVRTSSVRELPVDPARCGRYVFVELGDAARTRGRHGAHDRLGARCTRRGARRAARRRRAGAPDHLDAAPGGA